MCVSKLVLCIQMIILLPATSFCLLTDNSVGIRGYVTNCQLALLFKNCDQSVCNAPVNIEIHARFI
jgi:hypothetical protein